MTSSHEVQLEVYPFCKNLLHNKISRKCLYLFWIYQRRIHNDTDGCKYKEEVRKRNETLGIVYMLIRRFYMSFPRGRFLKFLGSCLLWVMSTEISVDIAVDIAVDSRSIVSRQSVDSRSIVGRWSVDSRSMVGR